MAENKWHKISKVLSLPIPIMNIKRIFGSRKLKKNKKSIMKNSGSFFVGIIAAATAGLIIGILIAPDKGERLRKNIKESAGDWTKKLSDLLVEGKEHVKSLASSLADGIDGLPNEEKDTKV